MHHLDPRLRHRRAESMADADDEQKRLQDEIAAKIAAGMAAHAPAIRAAKAQHAAEPKPEKKRTKE